MEGGAAKFAGCLSCLLLLAFLLKFLWLTLGFPPSALLLEPVLSLLLRHLERGGTCDLTLRTNWWWSAALWWSSSDLHPCLHLRPFPSFLVLLTCLQCLYLQWFHCSPFASVNLLFSGNYIMFGWDGNLKGEEFNYSLGRKTKLFLSLEFSETDITSSGRSQVFSAWLGLCRQAVIKMWGCTQLAS